MKQRIFILKTQQLLFMVLAIIFILIIIFLGILTSMFTNRSLQEYTENYYTEETYRMAYIINSNMEAITSLEQYQDSLTSISNEFSTPIKLYDQDNEEVFASEQLVSMNSQVPFQVEVPIIRKGEPVGHLVAYYDLRNPTNFPALATYQTELNNHRKLIYISTSIVVLILSYIIARRLSTSLKRSSKIAQKVVQGNREAFFPRKGTQEVRQLVNAINTLLSEFNNVENWRKQLMQDLTHELRTPLTSVLTRLEAIIDGVYPKTEENLNSIYSDIERLARLVNNVQQLSDAEGARFKLDFKDVNVANLVKSVHESFLFVAKEKNISLEFVHPNRPCRAQIDHDRIIQVVTNIVSNALKYTPPGGKVIVGVNISGNEVIIYCKDNGIGIAKEELTLVFNRFYRTDKSRSRESGGTGVGLSVSRALVEAHGGTIGVESVEGNGSTFWVRLPISHTII